MCFELRNIIYLKSSPNQKEIVKLIQLKLSCRKAWDQRLIKHEFKKGLLRVIVVVVVDVVAVVVVVVVVVVAFVVAVGTVATVGARAPKKTFKTIEFFKSAIFVTMFNIEFEKRLLAETCEASDACHLPPRAALTNPEKSSFVGDKLDAVVAYFHLRTL